MTNLEASVVNECTLNCRHCVHFMPEYGHPPLPSADLVISDLQKLLPTIERIDVFTLLGGEALLHPELHRMVSFLLKSDKIGRVDIQTTGTLAPPTEIVKLFPNPRLRFKIENFGRLSDKIKAFSMPKNLL